MSVSKKGKENREREEMRNRVAGLRLPDEEAPHVLPSSPLQSQSASNDLSIHNGLPEPEIEYVQEKDGSIKLSGKGGHPVEKRNFVTIPLPKNYIRMLDAYFRTKGLNRTNGLRGLILEFMRENQIDQRYDIKAGK